MLDEIDSNTWVLEPDYPSRSCTNRRIALGNNASIHIDLNSSNPTLLPECRFMGADNGITIAISNFVFLELTLKELIFSFLVKLNYTGSTYCS